MNRFSVSTFKIAGGGIHASVIDLHTYSVVYHRPDSKEAREFVQEYCDSLNKSYKFIPEPFGNISGGGA